MRRVVRRLASSSVLGLLCSCAPVTTSGGPEAPQPEAAVESLERAAGQDVVTFLGRELRLEPFLAGFPYAGFDVDLERGRIFFMERGDGYTLRSMPVPRSLGTPEGRLVPSDAPSVSEVDWSARSFWGGTFHGASNALWIHADEANDERMNLWTLDLETQALEQVTEADYVYSYGFSGDQTKVAYLPREGTQAPFRTCLRVMDVETRADREVVCDDPELRFTWSSVVFSPDNRRVYFNAQLDGDRTRVQLVEVDLETDAPKVSLVTDPARSRSSPSALRSWIGDELLFLANDDGYRNLYAYDPSTRRREVRQVTRFDEDISSAEVVSLGVAVTHGTPRGSTLEVIEPSSGRSRYRESLAGTARMLAGHGDTLVWSTTAPDDIYSLHAGRLSSRGGQDEGPAISLSSAIALTPNPALQEAVIACRARRVEVETFDEDPATGARRRLHAFVLEPARPVEPERRLVMLRSFYGGSNTYNVYDNVLCAAGVTVVSASVRGSSGFGKEFYGLNNGDLGGLEIVDLFELARWASSTFGVPSSRVGVYGRSHGGYATMRAMTFPLTYEGHPRFEFGFGLAEAGFSDIVAFHDATNIPDWVVLEAGDPAVPEDRARLEERSPVNHTERLSRPIFLLHGSNDWRVPVDGSRQFVAAAEANGKDVVYVEFPGQGHRVKGVARNVEAWQRRLDFLTAVLSAATEEGAQTSP